MGEPFPNNDFLAERLHVNVSVKVWETNARPEPDLLHTLSIINGHTQDFQGNRLPRSTFLDIRQRSLREKQGVNQTDRRDHGVCAPSACIAQCS
jgi:hypothetical protein